MVPPCPLIAARLHVYSHALSWSCLGQKGLSNTLCLKIAGQRPSMPCKNTPWPLVFRGPCCAARLHLYTPALPWSCTGVILVIAMVSLLLSFEDAWALPAFVSDRIAYTPTCFCVGQRMLCRCVMPCCLSRYSLLHKVVWASEDSIDMPFSQQSRNSRCWIYSTRAACSGLGDIRKPLLVAAVCFEGSVRSI